MKGLSWWLWLHKSQELSRQGVSQYEKARAPA